MSARRPPARRLPPPGRRRRLRPVPDAAATAAGPPAAGRPAWVLRLAGERIALRVPVRPAVVGAALVAALLAALVLSIAAADSAIGIDRIVAALLGGGDRQARYAVHELRLPRAAVTLLVGAALGAAGAVFQSITRNPLGSPDIIGFTAGASAAAVFQIVVLGGGIVATDLAAVAGGLLVAAAVYLLSLRGGHGTGGGYQLILVGIGLSGVLTGVSALLMTRADLTQASIAAGWLAGSVNGRGWEHGLPLAVALAALLPPLIALGGRLRAMELGDEVAIGLGVPVARTRLLVLALGVGVTAAAVGATGPITFVALAAPQIAKRLTGSGSVSIVSGALVGAVLLASADVLTQRLFPDSLLPVGITTSVLGGVYLAVLLAREWRRRSR